MPWCAGSAGLFADARIVRDRAYFVSTFRAGVLGQFSDMGFLLWIVAVLLVVGGAINLMQGQILFGVVLIVVGLAVGPGGYSIFNSRSARA